MAKRLFLLDGMALVYRAHFAFATRPIRTSQGINTSAVFGLTNTILDILQNWAPTHIAVAFDTAAPTARHRAFPSYKAQRESMPEELAAALPHVRRLLDAFRIRALSLDGYEADDLIGTIVHHAEPEGFESFMVTPDKDFGQLVTASTSIWKPGRQGGDPEILGPAEVCARWEIANVGQVIDLLGLAGDTSDNIPGVAGVGEKTAAKLLARFNTLEGILANAAEVPGRVGEALRTHAETARLSRSLATIQTNVPMDVLLEEFALQPRDDAALRAICVEFEFNAIGRRLFGDDFKAGRGPGQSRRRTGDAPAEIGVTGDLFALQSETAGTPRKDAAGSQETVAPQPAAPASSAHRTLADVPHTYCVADTDAKRRELAAELGRHPAFCFDTETDGLDPRTAKLLGIAFSFAAGTGWYVPVSDAAADSAPFLDALANPSILKIGHNLKFDLAVLRWQGIAVSGPFFDTMIAHALVEPELRHGMDYVSQTLLDYTPIPIERLIGPKGPGQPSMAGVPVGQIAEYSAEDADVTWQLRDQLTPLLAARGQERVFYEVEMPVLPALVAMEAEGIRVDTTALAGLSADLGRDMASAEADIHRLAGREFNVNSNRQLGAVLFDELRLVEKPAKTATGQYSTDERTLQTLAADHEIVRRVLDYRAVSKLKSTYADALPEAVFKGTGRVHTTFHQAATTTGRLSSVDPNLQNIPIRTERGQEIRRAFVPREGWRLLSADYSQIELRIIAALAAEKAMIEAFRRGEDIHTTTAALVFGVSAEGVTPEMRRRAKMVNFGIAYGISAFGLAQRLGIPRKDASGIIENYYFSYPGIRRYMDHTIELARARGYVETLTGRRRPLRDINSANGTIRSAAERNAINAPIQGTAADMIKIAMARIHEEIGRRGLRSRQLLQVHDELVFDLHPPEEVELRQLVEEHMRTALPLPGDVPIVVELGTGATWLEAH